MSAPRGWSGHEAPADLETMDEKGLVDVRRSGHRNRIMRESRIFGRHGIFTSLFEDEMTLCFVDALRE